MNEVASARCRRCLLTDAMPGIRIDETGLCNICQATPPAEQLAEVRAQLHRDMEGVIREHRGTRPYECVVAYSGGKDSSYTLKLLVETYELRCLAVTIDNGFLSSSTLDNCRAVCGGLGVDHVLFAPSRKFAEKMYRTSAMDEGVHPPAAVRRASSICSSCIAMVNTHVLQKALQVGAPIVAGGYIGGQLPREAAMTRVRSGERVRARAATVDRFVRHFGEDARPYFELSPADASSDREVVVINPMLGLSVSEDEIIAALAPLGWSRPTDTGVTSTNCRLNDLGVYVHSRRHGFHPYAAEIAEQLRHGLMTQDQALHKLTTLPRREQVMWIADRIGLAADKV
jgi:tRNA(Ile)-lysidine synthase TilS/MesJ